MDAVQHSALRLVDETTWGEFQKRDGDELALQMTNPSENGPYNIEMYFDNFRVVKIPII